MIQDELLAAAEAGEWFRMTLLLQYRRMESGTLSQAQLDALLYRAVGANEMEIAERLLELGANSRYRNPERGWPVIYQAACTDNADLVALLVCYGADVNATDGDGSTALHMAAVHGQRATVSVLLRAGADPNIRDRSGCTPLSVAEDEEELEVLELMRNYEAEPVISRARKRLLMRLEAIMGECYNPNIQNYGPGGMWEGEGRSYAYPVTFVWHEGHEHKKMLFSPDDPDEEVLLSGFYKFGANWLPVYRNLDLVLRYLEKHHGLVIEDEGAPES